jgi:molecular chaperone HscB
MISVSDNYFVLFGLPVRFEIDNTELQKRFLKLQSQVHPDRFTNAPPAEQRIALQWATHVNEAFHILKNPVNRAAYWCELQGQPVDSKKNTAMSAQFLMQQMQWHETLEELSENPRENKPDLNNLYQEIQFFEKNLLAQLSVCIDTNHDAVTAVELTKQLMFINQFQKNVKSAVAKIHI